MVRLQCRERLGGERPGGERAGRHEPGGRGGGRELDADGLDPEGKPSAVGISVGSVCGLVAITHASGYVGPMPSIIIGLVAGVLCNYVGSWRARTTLDDPLDVFACHGAGGISGTLATGLFASSLINSGGPNGLFF